MYKLLIFLFCLQNLSLAIAQRADYLIVENPSSFIILDKYEQNNSTVFPPFTPFRILEEHTLLSDDLTPALKVELLGKNLYIIRNEDGKIARQESSGYLHIFRNCTPIGDSIRVLKDRSLLFYEKYFTQKPNRRNYLQKNDILIRIFKYKQSYYVKRINRSSAYGWCRLPASRSWRKLEQQSAGRPILSESLRLRIKTFIAQINRTYEKYFDYFNRTYSGRFSPPHWQISELNDGMDLAFVGLPYSNLKRSNEVVVRNLETLLLGSGFTVSQIDDMLLIRSKKQGQR
ncbi:MAG TPA: hypothetical protein EYP36_02945 [Calditrichaeota bacterium]|nr:hypothetical protein [Calditrichota bacterium]